jgi:hypothetical protein
LGRLSEKTQAGYDARKDHQRPVEDSLAEGDSPFAGGDVYMPLFTQLRGIEILRTSPFGISRKQFAEKVSKITHLRDVPGADVC